MNIVRAMNPQNLTQLENIALVSGSYNILIKVRVAAVCAVHAHATGRATPRRAQKCGPSPSSAPSSDTCTAPTGVHTMRLTPSIAGLSYGWIGTARCELRSVIIFGVTPRFFFGEDGFL